MTWVEESVPLTKENVDNILKYLPLLEDKANKFYREASQDESGAVVLPFYRRFVTKFKWMDWITEAREYSASDEKLSKADLNDDSQAGLKKQ